MLRCNCKATGVKCQNAVLPGGEKCIYCARERCAASPEAEQPRAYLRIWKESGYWVTELWIDGEREKSYVGELQATVAFHRGEAWLKELETER